MRILVRSLLSRGGLALVSVALAVPLTLLLPPLEQAPYALFFTAVVVSAWYGGSWAGLLATALSGLALDLFFVPPLYALGVDRADAVRMGSFLAAGALIGLLQARRERADEAVRQRERRRGEFLAVMAHELRNFLAPVVGAVRVLRVGGVRPSEAERCLEMAERQAQNMARLINDLLDAARIEQGKLGLCKRPVELTETVRHAVAAARPLVESRGHVLTLDLPPGPLRLEADATRLEQILLNLLSNAARYTEPGGLITVTVEQGPAEAVLRVRDTGVGIPAEKLPHIFDLFEQAEVNTPEGLGVGLSLVRGLARLHGGDATAQSDGPGRGSEFQVRLPLTEPSP
jgi:signal transduction histidine kinase